MALVVKDMWEDPVCDNHQLQINTKIMTSAHNRCTTPSSAAVSWGSHHFAHRTVKENEKSLVHTVDLEVKNTLCWYWFLRSWSCDVFPHCRHAAASSKASGFGKAETLLLRGATEPLMMGPDLMCSVTTERQQGSGETWWPCGAQRCHPGTGRAASCLSTHRTTATICSGRFSSLPRGPQFHTEQGAPTGWNNQP